MKLTSIVFIVCAFFGCSVEHTIDVSKIESVTVSFYDDHKFKKSESFNPESAQYKQVINWLSGNTKNWKPQIATIAPGRAIVSGKSFSLNIRENSVVLNYEHTDGEYRQLSKSIETNELAFIFEKNP